MSSAANDVGLMTAGARSLPWKHRMIAHEAASFPGNSIRSSFDCRLLRQNKAATLMCKQICAQQACDVERGKHGHGRTEPAVAAHLRL